MSERRNLLIVVGVLVWGLLAGAATAHPLGNNTVNRQARLQISHSTLQVRYLMDVAEIPTLLEAQRADLDHDGIVTEQEWSAYTKQWAQQVGSQLQIEFDGRPLALQLQGQQSWVQAGAADLSILRLEANFAATLSSHEKTGTLHYRDRHKPELAGWKEVWISAGDGIAVTRSTASQKDRSAGLTDYNGFLTTPPDELAADATFAFGNAGPAPALQAGAPPAEPTTGQESSAAVVPLPAGHASTVSVSWSQESWSFFKLGVHHIATGWDHLVFLLGLLLLVKSLPQLIRIVTAFTIAHSITLALAANHWVTPPGAWVEPGIALTIAYVGLINIAWRHRPHGAWLAFGFGLVHGFGFAGALSETLAEQGGSANHWLVSLLSFNLGIEAFQLLLVCLVVPLLRAASRHAWFGMARQLASYSVLSAGVVWFLLRTVII